MSIEPSGLSQLAEQLDRFHSEYDRAHEASLKAQDALALAETRANSARGRLEDFLVKASIGLPCTIAITGTDRLLTIYDDGYGTEFIVTTLKS